MSAVHPLLPISARYRMDRRRPKRSSGAFTRLAYQAWSTDRAMEAWYDPPHGMTPIARVTRQATSHAENSYPPSAAQQREPVRR